MAMKELCRICAERSNYFRSLFSTHENGITLAAMISACSGTISHETIELFPNICCQCISLLNSAYKFHNLLKSSEMKLKQILPSDSLDADLPDIATSTSKTSATDEPVMSSDECEHFMCDIKVEQLELIEPTIIQHQDSSFTKSQNRRNPSSKKDLKDPKKAKLKQQKTTKLDSKTKLNGKTFECYKCKMEFSSVWKTIVHLRGHDAEAKYKCLVCSEQYIESADFNQHACKHSQIGCEYCSEQFDATIKLLNHLSEAHDEKRCHRCPKCLQYFEMSCLLGIHLSEHPICSQEVDETIKEYRCEICLKRFAKYYLLQQHLVIHSDDRPHLCSECGKAFKSTSSLATHRIGHKEKTIKCPDCPMKFNRMTNFKKHKDVHLNMKYICDICQADLQSRYAHRNHMRKHRLTDADKRHKCDYCSMRFFRKNKLTQHIRTHTGEKPFKCDYCENRAFAQKCDLTKHLRKHLGDAIYHCEKCSTKFKYYKDLQQHLLDHYKLQKESVLS